MSKDKDKNDNIIFRIPASLKEEFKITCDKHGFKMSEIVRDFIEQFVKKHGPKPLENNNNEIK